MKIDQRTYKITGLTAMMGSQPADPDVRATYIASKAPSSIRMEEEEAMMEDIEKRGLTVFMRDKADGALCMMDYMFIGYLKEAVSALSAENGVKMAGGKVGTYVFAEPRVMRFEREDGGIFDADSVLSRPLRAQTMQGPRVALTASELVDAPWGLTVTIKLIENAGTAKSRPITWDTIEDALDYGQYKGLGQWRNGGFGRFSWKRIA